MLKFRQTRTETARESREKEAEKMGVIGEQRVRRV